MNSLTTTLILCKLATTAVDPAAVREVQLLRTWRAVCWVESRGDPRAVNKRENAVGICQIRPIMLADANRIIGRQKWTLADRLDPVKSYEIFRLIVRYYHPKGGPEQWARTWNGGPTGARKAATLKYWAKVRAQMKRMEPARAETGPGVACGLAAGTIAGLLASASRRRG